ncbi:MAG: hypothetical protein RR088_04175 [Clostridia bacterium]
MKKRKYRIAIICVILSFSILMSGCSFKRLTPSELLKPPTSTENIREIKKNIKTEIAEDTVPIIPVSGEFRNSIIFIDLNNDRVDELIYLYSTTQDKTNPLLCVFKKEKDRYVKQYIISAIAIGIDYIDFTDYNFDSIPEITVGYTQANTEQKLLTVYNIKENKPSEILSATYNMQSIINKEANNKYLFIATLTTKDLPAHGKLLEYKNDKFITLSECEMNGAITSYASILTDVKNDITRIIVNENIDATTLSTEIIGIEQQKLINYTFAEGKPKFPEQLMRSSSIYAQDIDKDAVIEFPSAVETQGKVQTSQSHVRVSKWYSFENGVFTPKMYLVLNPAERYYINFPEKWLSLVNIKTDLTGTNFSFFYKMPDDGEELLFSILSLSKEDYEIKKVNDQYQLLKQLPDRMYAAYIPKVESKIAKDIQPTLDEIQKAFVKTTIKQR